MIAGFFCASDQTEIRIAFPTPDKTIQNVMRKLRQCQKRYKIHFRGLPIPIASEKPVVLMPNASIPEKLFEISDCPKSSEKDQPVV